MSQYPASTLGCENSAKKLQVTGRLDWSDNLHGCLNANIKLGTVSRSQDLQVTEVEEDGFHSEGYNTHNAV